jgi:hypothetical protein
LLTEILYDEKKERVKHNKDIRAIDNLIDKTLGRVSLYHKDDKVVCMHNGIGYEDITIGGILESEHGRFKIQDIDGSKMKINGNWYHKSEFEPAIVIKFKGRHRGKDG